MKNLSKILIATSLVAFASCEPDFDEPVEDFVVTSGEADFSKYIALGNSLTSGYSDNALFSSGQVNSYPNMLATQMAMAGGGSFAQPLMPDDIGGFTNLGVAGRMTLQLVDGSLTPVSTPAQSPLTPASGGPFGNMGVPGAKSYHLLAPNYGDPAGIGTYANPYFVRFASSSTTTVLADAAAQAPTFVSLWIGSNDVLSYATSGGVGTNQMAANNTDVTTYGSNDISHPQVVAGSIQMILETLINQGGAKGAIANVPGITNIPFFTTVPYAPLDPSNPSFGAMIPALNAQFGQLNAVFDYLGVPERKVVFNTDAASAVVIEDETLPNLFDQIRSVLVSQGMDMGTATILADTYKQSRQATSDELMIFTSQTVIGQINTDRVAELMAMGVPQEQAAQLSVNGITYPLTDNWVLIPSEIQAINAATDAYNAAIQQLANNYGLAFVDANRALEQLNTESGITYFGNTYTATYVSGGAFSLDGVHLSAKGYAVVANYFIDAINLKFGSTLRNVNPNNYPGVVIP
ncbi:SGNH/GDSL hydrolase family protein [Moheibacter lacus]|uniref:G-D-S-L family lipolytic protein n=1 Tax=Moheibacter lacus TaxID=2745851 RepID=A0A838ZNK9_9FLAO|nr:SGNH/GDSL hydrolase family protein [Moheibacter lacus]MBA5629296.1 G-D-S-L family lipolytic protein [Moheibacter lacus]